MKGIAYRMSLEKTFKIHLATFVVGIALQIKFFRAKYIMDCWVNSSHNLDFLQCICTKIQSFDVYVDHCF